MKKLILSSFIVVLFVFYSLQQRMSVAGYGSNSQDIPYSNKNSPASGSSGIPFPTNTQAAGVQGNGKYKAGEYTGDVTDAYYGNVQVKAIVQNGRITDVQFLQYPNDRENSILINQQAMPILTSEAVQTQNAQVDIVSGATDTSMAFMQSLSSALSKAQ